MKRFLLLLLLLLPWRLSAQGYNSYQTTTFTSVTTATPIYQNSTIGYHELFWTVSGTVSTCTVAIDSSPDNSTWPSAGILAGQTCTTNGHSAVTAGTANYIRVNMTAISGAGATVAIVYEGWAQNPAGGGTCSGCVQLAPSGDQTITGTNKLILSATNGSITLGPNTSNIDLNTTTNGAVGLGFANSGTDDFVLYRHSGGAVLAVSEAANAGLDDIYWLNGVTWPRALGVGVPSGGGTPISGVMTMYGSGVSSATNCARSVNSTATTVTESCPINAPSLSAGTAPTACGSATGCIAATEG